ncbi:MAG TPA: SDR family oxidoreductase [Mycobacteriales bacterium]|jgi:NAD(P)-dependent dehydrogenase (short-subunit alcohol dehydrogenase family)|nr:SDR family oxidoreductase [Mycobacteriales bacterium]
MGLLDGKVAIVTGAGRGVGREEALLLASEGARVVVNDLGGDAKGEGSDATPAQQVADEIKAAGGEAVVNGADISSWDGAKSLITQAVEEFGDLNILVNNAGILRDAMSFNTTEEDWDAVIRVHLKGHFATARFAAEYWRNRSKAGEAVSGRIINTTSDSGLFANPGQSGYDAAKSGIATLTIVLARELERYGVTANAIAPRARTRLTATIGMTDEPDPNTFDELSPANIAPVVGWLSTDAAKDVNGQVFIVWAGHVIRAEGWHPVDEIAQDSRWTVEGLVGQQNALFGGKAPAGVAPHSIPGFPG